jgi:2-polyprenyl-3-methyl-5-hydroxy-6-metoxy-1,4-benzoquinol methylase
VFLAYQLGYEIAMENDFLTLQSSLEPDALREKLRTWEPWSHRVDFDNGVSTLECARRAPFSESPLRKFRDAAVAVPFGELTGGRLLDIGCNAGYNSIHAALKYRFWVTGVDVIPRHIEAARFLAGLAGASCEFQLASAETFSRPGEFDVILHFGTLYHLPNPVLSLRATCDNLRPGGYLALETQVYDHPEDGNICYFMHMQNNDQTNFWALSTSVLTKCLELLGFREIRQLMRVPVTGLAEHMARIILVARKPEKPSVRPYALQHVDERRLPEDCDHQRWAPAS